MNKKYNVYGIGNALVDIDFTVTDEFLKKYSVQKGMMTLVDAETQKRLINAINQQNINRKSGGSAANTVIAAAQFGGRVFYSCKVSDDEYGDFYLEDLKKAGVATNLDNTEREQGITGKCLVMITDDAERTMNTFLGITVDISKKEVSVEDVKASEYVYLEGYLTASDSGFEAMKYAREIARQSGVKTALTLSDPSVVGSFQPRFEELTARPVDLIFCNEAEAMQFTKTTSVADARELLKQTTRHFVITKGSDGAVIFDGNDFIEVGANHVRAVDTNGAGDMFAGAFLYGLTHNKGFAEAGALASLAASKVVSQYGPRLAQEKVDEIMKELKR